MSSPSANATTQALLCALADDSSPCLAICPNPDISGVGVRSAFYIQSVLNALLVVFSRTDSVPSTWAATLLTGSLVIAAMVQKQNQSITLHHAILTMNFATLSCISSLAVAPTLSIWRLTPREYYAQRVARDFLDGEDEHEHEDSAPQHRLVGTAVDAIAGRHKKKIERAQSRQRLFLTIALLTQVVLQWAWGVVLFVSWSYSQTNCSGDTRVVFFLRRFTAREINDSYFVVWAFWLLFSLGITMAMTVVLALTSPSRARSWTLRSSSVSSIGTHSSGDSSTRPFYEHVYRSTLQSIPSWKDHSAQRIFWYNILCIVLWLIYLISSEIQIQVNSVFPGENIFTGFGQITALLLSLAPLWSLTVALYKWPRMQRKLERRRRRAQRASLQAQTSTSSAVSPVIHISPVDASSASDDDDAHLVAAVPARDRAAPLSASGPHLELPHAWARGGGGRATAVRARAPRGPRQPHARFPSLALSLDDVDVPRSTAEEWNELVSFPQTMRGPS